MTGLMCMHMCELKKKKENKKNPFLCVEIAGLRCITLPAAMKNTLENVHVCPVTPLAQRQSLHCCLGSYVNAVTSRREELPVWLMEGGVFKGKGKLRTANDIM